MTKQEIIETLSNCIEIVNLSENTYVRNKLTQVAEALIEEWQESNAYDEVVKQVLNYDETMSNLDKIRIR
jgi:FMN-dependent NADH-azoreductase